MRNPQKKKKENDPLGKEQTVHYRLLAERSFDLVMAQNMEQEITYVNHIWAKTLGYTAEECIGKPAYDFLAAEYRSRAKEWNLERKKGNVSTFQYEVELITKGGKRIPVEIHSSPIRSEAGEFIEILIVGRDLREKKKNQAALLESESRYYGLFEAAPFAIWDEDFSSVKEFIDKLRENGVEDFNRYFTENPAELEKCIQLVKIIDANQKAVELHGAKNKEDLLENNLQNIFSNKTIEAFQRGLMALIAGYQEYSDEAEALRVDGTVFYQSMHWKIQGGEKSNWAHVIVSTQNISKLQEAKNTLSQQLRELNVLQATAFTCAQAKDIDSLIRQITNIIGNTLYPDIYGIFLVDEKQESLSPHTSYSFLSKQKKRSGTYPFSHGMAGRAAATRKVIRADDVRENKDYIAINSSIRSEICVPIKVTDRVLGVINVESTKLGYFTEADERLLTTIASQVATAMQKIESLTIEKQKRAIAETLQKIAAALTTTLDQQKSIELILNALYGVVKFTSASIQLLRGDYLEIVGGRGNLVLEVEKDRRYPYPGNNPNTIVLQRLKPLIINDAQHSYPSFKEMPSIRAWLGAPLIADQRPIGLLTLDSDKVDHFTEQDIETVGAFAHHAALSLRNAQIFEKEQKRRQEAETLREIGLAITSSLDLDSAIQQILAQLSRVIDYDSAGVQILKDGYAVNIGGRGWSDSENIMQMRFPLKGDTPNARVYSTRKTVILNDAPKEHVSFNKPPHNYIHSWMGIPMSIRGEMIGMLTVDSKEKNHFDESSAKIAGAFATQAAIAIENARLFDEERKRLEEAERLRQAAITINSALSLDVVLETVASQMSEAIRASGCAIYSWDKKRKSLETLVDHNHSHPELSIKFGSKLALKKHSIMQSVLDSNRPALLEIDNSETSEAERDWLEAQNVSKLLILPLIAGKKTIGLIKVYEDLHSKRSPYTADDVRLVEGLASHAALAVENARLFNAEKTRRQEAETLRQAALTISSSLNLGQVLDTILASIQRVIPFDSAAVMLKKGENIEVVRGYNLPNLEEKIGMRIPLENGLYQEMLKKWHPIILDDAQQNPRFEKWNSTDYIHGWMGVPLIARGEMIGYIAIDSSEVGTYQEKHAELAQVFAHQAASAIANATLYQEAVQSAERRAILHRVSQDISRGIQSSEQTYEAIYRAAKELMPCDAFVISIREEENDLPDKAVYLIDEGKRYPAQKVPREESIVTFIEQDKGTYITKDLTTDELSTQKEKRRFGTGKKARSMLVSPMYIGAKLKGGISVQSYSPNVYGEEERILLEMLASHAVAAIENTRLLEKAEQRGREFAELYQVSQDLVTNQDINLFLKAMLERATRLTGVSTGSIYIYDEKNAELATSTFYGLSKEDEEKVIGISLKIGEGLAGKVASELKPMIVNNYREWDDRSPKYENTLPFTSVLELPLIYSGNLLGVLSLFEIAPKSFEFNKDHERIMSLFATQLASALNSAKQLEQITTRLAELEAINQLSTALRTTQTPEEMLPILLDEVNHSLHVDTSVIWMEDEENEDVYRAIASGWIADLPPKRQKADAGIIGHVLTEGEAYVSHDLATDPLIVSERPDLIPANWTGLWVPIRVSNITTGVIGVIAKIPRIFDNGDRQILNIMAKIAGNAFQRARLHHRTEQQLKRLTALRNIDISINTQTDLHTTLQLLIEQTITQLNVDAADILLVDKTTKNLSYFVGNGFKSPNTTATQLRAGDGLPGKAIRQRKTLHSNNLLLEGSPSRRNWFAEEDFNCYFCIPLNAKGNILGVLEIFKHTHVKISPRWQDFSETLANQAAIAIENHDLIQDLKASNEELARAYDTTLEGWGKALELRDKETQGHTLNVAELTLKLARYLGIPKSEIIHVYRGALLHDIGKMGIPDNILHKPGPLTKEEWLIMRQHPTFAFNMLASIPYLLPAIDIPYCHHERWDGAGYPRGLKEEEIPLAARIFSIVDVWDALLTNRPYREAWPKQVVINYIKNESGTRFDPTLVEKFIEMVEQENRQESE